MNAKANNQKHAPTIDCKHLSRQIGWKLSEAYAGILDSPIPDKLLDTIERLNALAAEDALDTTDSTKSGRGHNRFGRKQGR